MNGPHRLVGPYSNENHHVLQNVALSPVYKPVPPGSESTCHRGFLRYQPPHGWFPSLKLTLTFRRCRLSILTLTHGCTARVFNLYSTTLPRLRLLRCHTHSQPGRRFPSSRSRQVHSQSAPIASVRLFAHTQYVFEGPRFRNDTPRPTQSSSPTAWRRDAALLAFARRKHPRGMPFRLELSARPRCLRTRAPHCPALAGNATSFSDA